MLDMEEDSDRNNLMMVIIESLMRVDADDTCLLLLQRIPQNNGSAYPIQSYVSHALQKDFFRVYSMFTSICITEKSRHFLEGDVWNH